MITDKNQSCVTQSVGMQVFVKWLQSDSVFFFIKTIKTHRKSDRR